MFDSSSLKDKWLIWFDSNELIFDQLKVGLRNLVSEFTISDLGIGFTSSSTYKSVLKSQNSSCGVEFSLELPLLLIPEFNQGL